MNLIVLTPDSEVFNGEVTAVNVPGVEGPFQILKNHAPIVAALDAGKLEIKLSDGKELHYWVERGFVEVLDNKINVLVQKLKESKDA
jgi:F-type H+-transporting ATPase subunit epsilon